MGALMQCSLHDVNRGVESWLWRLGLLSRWVHGGKSLCWRLLTRGLARGAGLLIVRHSGEQGGPRRLWIRSRVT